MKASLLLAILYLGSSFLLPGQIVDSFNDGNLLKPDWFGDTSHFIINSLSQLQLDAQEAGTSTIYLPYSSKRDQEISLFFQMDFAPSANNHIKVYLILDTPIIDLASGFYLQIGENGSEDNWELYQLESGTKTLLAEGPSGQFADDPAHGCLRINFEENQMIIASRQDPNDPLITNDPISIDPIITGNSFFGLQCTYTSTRTDKFSFDDLYIGSRVPDTIPPKVVQVDVFSDSLIVFFSEPIDTSSLQLSQFEVNNSIGSPTSLSFITRQSLLLRFEDPFLANTPYLITLYNIRDVSHNVNELIHVDFERIELFKPQAGEIIISEFLADPTPSQGLPESEFIELFNASITPFNLEDLILIVNDREVNLPEHILGPDEYVILCRPEDVEPFVPLGKVLAVDRFPLIRNEQGAVSIKTTDDQYLHQATYRIADVADKSKRSGGWSYEIINPTLYCEKTENWAISIHPEGGTPGRQNSVWDLDYLGESMEFTRLLATDSSISFELSQSLFLPPPPSIQPEIYTIEDAIIDSVVFSPPFYDQGSISTQLQPGIIHTINFRAALISCTHSKGEIQLKFGVAESAKRGDIVINEILFNPKGEGADYIEINNISEKILNIQDLQIFNRENKQVSEPINYQFGMLPNTLLCLTTNIENIQQEYAVANPHWLHSCDLPPLPNESGSPVLFFDQGIDTIPLDGMMYHEDMQHPLLSNPDGVSLERIDVRTSPLSRENWHSASATAGFGTPTGANSQGFQHAEQETRSSFSLDKQVFAPNSIEGQNVLKINYQLNKPGYICTVEIFDLFGQRINTTHQQTLLGLAGDLEWNGRDDSDDIVPLGRYIVLIEAFHPTGSHIRQKLSCVVANYF